MRFRANRHRAGYPAENKGDCHERSRVLRGKGGFSLIEVMISASILAVGLLGIATIFPVAYLNVDSGGKQTEATSLAQSIIEQLRSRATTVTTFDGVIGAFPPNGFNGMNTTNCQGDATCQGWRGAVDRAFGGQLPLGVIAITMTCQDGAGDPAPDQPKGNDDCTGGSQPTWIATVNVTVNWNDLRGPRTVTLTTRMMRP